MFAGISKDIQTAPPGRVDDHIAVNEDDSAVSALLRSQGIHLNIDDSMNVSSSISGKRCYYNLYNGILVLYL